MKKYFLFALLAVFLVGCDQPMPDNPSGGEGGSSTTPSAVVTGEAKDITHRSVVLYGEVNVEVGDYESIEWGMMYSKDKAELESRNGQRVYSKDALLETLYSVSLSGLDSETKYYYCAFLYLNGKQYKFGETQEFSTLVAPEIKGIGTFSVSATKQVTFSPGNLQYHPANNEWRFAENQADYVGSANSNISATYNGWIDLFGWGTGNAPTKSSTSYSDYQTFVDWGTNQIGSDTPNTWRTLTYDEWMYIFYNRPNAQSLFALGSVNGVNGTIILPDNWTTPVGVSFVASTTKGLYWDGSYYYNSNGDNFSHNTYTSEQWSKMEQAGAVFLPASGRRWGTGVANVGYLGSYWSSPEIGELDACRVGFDSYSLYPRNDYDRFYGFSVRLAQDL